MKQLMRLVQILQQVKPRYRYFFHKTDPQGNVLVTGDVAGYNEWKKFKKLGYVLLRKEKISDDEAK